MKTAARLIVFAFALFLVVPLHAKSSSIIRRIKDPPQKIGIDGGLGIIPPMFPTADEQAQGARVDLMYAAHLGYTFFHIVYVSYDLFVLSPYAVRTLTTQVSDDGELVQGYYRPGMMNLWGIGLRPVIQNLSLLVEGGLNYLYVYRQKELFDSESTEDVEANLGVNIRFGVGLQYNHWSLVVAGTTVFASFPRMFRAITGMFSADPYVLEAARMQFIDGFLPSIHFAVHL